MLDNRPLIVPTEDALAEAAARIIVDAFTAFLKSQHRVLFLPSSGRTPVKTYAYLARKYKNTIDWSRVTLVQMDEYKSTTLAPDLYFRKFLEQHLIAPLGIENFIFMTKPGSTQLIAPEDYAGKIKSAGPIDFALHGIGQNGHIGFNEPGSSSDSITRIVTLNPETRRDNFPNLKFNEAPSQGMTLGLQDLSRVKHSLLIASGETKADAIRRLLNQSSISRTPACAMLNCSDFGIIIDPHAAKLIRS